MAEGLGVYPRNVPFFDKSPITESGRGNCGGNDPAGIGVIRLSTAADRKRRYRARQRDGVIVVPLPVPASTIAALADVGWLDPERQDDREAIADALIRQLRWWEARFGPDATERL